MSQNLFQVVLKGLKEQYGAALAMLCQAINDCSEELWEQQENGPPFWKIIYHTLFFLDFYLGNSKKEREEFKSFFPNNNGHRLDVITNKEPLTRVQLLEYLDYVKDKSKAKIDELSEETLVEDTAFEWHGDSQFATFIYNLRHVMLHLGALNSLLVRTGIKTQWVSKS